MAARGMEPGSEILVVVFPFRLRSAIQPVAGLRSLRDAKAFADRISPNQVTLRIRTWSSGLAWSFVFHRRKTG